MMVRKRENDLLLGGTALVVLGLILGEGALAASGCLLYLLYLGIKK